MDLISGASASAGQIHDQVPFGGVVIHDSGLLRFDGSGRSFQSASVEGVKQHGSGREWFAGDGKISRLTSSRSPARKAASAMIAKIPLPLSRHIAAVYRA